MEMMLLIMISFLRISILIIIISYSSGRASGDLHLLFNMYSQESVGCIIFRFFLRLIHQLGRKHETRRVNHKLLDRVGPPVLTDALAGHGMKELMPWLLMMICQFGYHMLYPVSSSLSKATKNPRIVRKTTQLPQRVRRHAPQDI